ncbi:ABC transporter ATP-binding protein [Geomesophilobacter sediminis]|uniref:ABC transporter ATP-binding protein n=1 Tax=Geomesophilobacter sediminis TaxID=2798584 RepID=A0A8J7M1F7_9BACT|nr:ABC transporter ATP-binding protein [Geomesophilobacter sediminis]MBJ6726889.1 ABC transporter ATP-binding protein [Geomesophilobacter sediminis]
MDAIRTEKLSKCFGEVRAVDELTLSVAEGELFALIGSDGAGKSTTLRMLTGIMDPTSGAAYVLGSRMPEQGPKVAESIGYMSQRFGLYPDLTVLENIRFYAEIHMLPRKAVAPRIEELLAFAKLAPFKDRPAGKLSGGMKQKLGLACALIHTPRVLFLDEPTNGVDPVSRRDFWRILYQLLAQGVTICVTTAYLDEAERCHRVGLMHKGKLLACDAPQALKGLVKGGVLELETADPRHAVRLLSAAFPTGSVALFGERVHLYAADPEQAAGVAVHALEQGGMSPPTIRPVEPSLEDVVVSMIREQEQGEGSRL